MDRFASVVARKAAAEEARYASIKHGDNAESVLRSKTEQTKDARRRQVYRLAIKALRQG